MLSGKRPRNNYGGPVNLTIYQYLAGCTKYYTLSAISTYIFYANNGGVLEYCGQYIKMVWLS
jgi:hypothetical protein